MELLSSLRKRSEASVHEVIIAVIMRPIYEIVKKTMRVIRDDSDSMFGCIVMKNIKQSANTTIYAII